MKINIKLIFVSLFILIACGFTSSCQKQYIYPVQTNGNVLCKGLNSLKCDLICKKDNAHLHLSLPFACKFECDNLSDIENVTFSAQKNDTEKLVFNLNISAIASNGKIYTPEQYGMDREKMEIIAVFPPIAKKTHIVGLNISSSVPSE